MKKLFATLLIGAFILSGCQSSWNKKVDLTPEEKQEINQQIKDIKVEISEYDGTEGTIPHLKMVELARAYKKLGNYKGAINVYKKEMDAGYEVRVFYHNLGRLYEDVKEYDLAVEQYQIIIDRYFENNYLYDITWAYIRAKERKTAEKFFNAWQREFHKTDEQTQEAIKDLREEEKENK